MVLTSRTDELGLGGPFGWLPFVSPTELRMDRKHGMFLEGFKEAYMTA